MPEADLTLLQTLIERMIADQRQDRQMLKSMERVLLRLDERMNLLDSRMGGLADEVALRLSVLFSERYGRIEDRLDRIEHPVQ